MIEKIKNLPLRTKVLGGILITLVLFMLTSAIVNWYKPVPNNPKTFVTAPPINSVANVPKVKIKVPSISVIPKDIATKKIPSLPEEVKTNPDVEVTNTATTGPSKAGFDIVSTYNKNDQSTSILYKEKDRKLFEFVNEKRVGIAYGVTSDRAQQVIKLNGEWTFFRAGEVYVSAEGVIKVQQLNQPEGTVFIKGEYRFGN